MPIGKNALKRVANNGYSSVATSAPDMEHSEVLAPETTATETAPETVAVETAPAVEAAPAVTPAPKKRGRPPKNKTVTAELAAEAAPVASAPKKTKKAAAEAAPVARKTKKTEGGTAPKAKKSKSETLPETSHPDGFVKVSCGMDMPVYLL